MNSGMKVQNIKYTNANISFGYAYNWVFARNCLACLSLTPAIAYKASDVDAEVREGRNGTANSIWISLFVQGLSTTMENTLWVLHLSERTIIIIEAISLLTMVSVHFRYMPASISMYVNNIGKVNKDLFIHRFFVHLSRSIQIRTRT